MKITITSLIIFIFLISNRLLAAEAPGVVSGKIIDAKSKTPMEFVNVSIRKKNTTGDLLQGSITDKEGTFSLGKLKDAEYTLTVSFMGYNTYTQDIVINSATQEIKIPTIRLKEDATALQEVQVVGTRSQMKFEIDKKVFNVDQSIVSAGGVASDVLSNIPSVEVDNDGEVSLRGSTSVTVWINGKASGLTAENRAQILEQMPAESIENIEVITNPSAKFSPEGTAGIINIVLKQNRQAGYYGSVQAGVDTRGGYNGSANINYNISKLDAWASIGYRNRQRRRGGDSDRYYTDISDTLYLRQKSSEKGGGDHINVRLGLTYHLTPSDHFTVSGSGMFGNRDNKSNIYYSSNVPGSYLSSLRHSESDNDSKGGNLEFGYKHDFNKNSNIDFTASYNTWDRSGSTVYNQTSVYPNDVEIASYQKQSNEVNTHSWDFQLDYVNAFNKNHKIEAGYKATLARENSPVETYSGTNAENATATENLFNRFIYDQDIHALYATYSGRIEKFGFQVGLRGEYSDITTRSPGFGESASDVEAYKKDYFSLFPSVFLTYALPKNNEIQLNYTRRISRPWGGQLNSFVNITDSTNISFGNPYLSPQYSNSFELNYIKNWNNHTISFSGYYRTTDDVIQRIRFLEEHVMKTTFENISQTTSAGTEIVVKNKLFKRLDLTTTLNMFYYKLDGFLYEINDQQITGASEEDFSWNVRMIANIALPKFFSLQLTGNYNAKQTIAQGYRKANYYLNAGIRKSFNKLSISINARDLLDSRKWSSVTSGTGFRQNAENWWGGREASLTLTYSFGNMKAKRKPQRDQNGGENGYEMEGGDF